MSWQAASLLLVGVAALAGLWWYERRRPSAKLVALVATLAAFAVAARVVFAAVPNVQGMTDVALLSGYVLGPAPGFVVGALSALVSNMFLGQGPWTPWQMVGWGAAGIGGAGLALVARRRAGRIALGAVCALAGLAFGAWMDLFTLLTYTAEPSLEAYLTIAVVSLPFNVAHAAGNAALALAFGPAFVRVLDRSRRRLDVRWRDAPARRPSAPAVVTACICVATLLAVPAVAAADEVSRAVRYLDRAQNGDGGFGAAPGQGSSQLITGWTVLGLEAAGRHPLDVRKGGHTPIDYMRTRAAELTETGELERTVLALRGAGLSARAFAGRDLVAELLRRRRADGSFAGLANWTAFGIMALRASGYEARSRAVSRSAAWLTRRQGNDGGFSLTGGASFVDETGAALQGLAAAGKARGRVARRAVRWLREVQNPDGGFGQAKGHPSNSQSTAWAVQGIVAARAAPASFRRASRSPLAYLGSLQQRDGSFRYSRSSAQTPVWVTAQVVAALRRKTFPLRPPRRRARAAVRRAALRPAARAPAAERKRARPDRGRGEELGDARPVVVRRTAARGSAGASPATQATEQASDEGAGFWIAMTAVGVLAFTTGAALVIRRRA